MDVPSFFLCVDAEGTFMKIFNVILMCINFHSLSAHKEKKVVL